MSLRLFLWQGGHSSRCCEHRPCVRSACEGQRVVQDQSQGLGRRKKAPLPVRRGRKCGANPAAEFARSGANGTASGYYVPTAAGRFTVTMGFRTSVGISDHACAYLTNSSAPKNGKKGVVAQAFKTFKVVRPTEARRASANARAALATVSHLSATRSFPMRTAPRLDARPGTTGSGASNTSYAMVSVETQARTSTQTA